jgi:hypothetical protein
MADYYPLIARAVDGLEHNTGENRRVLYERARGALLKQLRGVEPALDEADITRERLALEDAIRTVEAEAASREPEEQQGPAERAPEPAEPTTSLRDQGLRDFRGTVAEAEGLGGGAAEATSTVRETYEAIPGTPRRAGEPRHGEPSSVEPGLPPFGPPPHAGEVPPVSEPDMAFHPQEAEPEHWPPSGRPLPPAYDEYEEASPPRVRSWARLAAIIVILLIVAGLASAAYWQRDTIMEMVAGLQSAPPPSEPGTTTTPSADQPKISDRVEPSTSEPPKAATAPAAAVAQKVVLYDEDPNNPQGKRYVGSAIWRTETVSPGPGLAPELAVRADVEIPERQMRMTWSLRRNTDKALPASHTIEVVFTLPADFAEGGVGNVPGILMKASEQARGVPLAGLAVKVTNGYFLIGLSAVELDKQRNIQMLKERDWFDIPIVYTSGKRAILAMEKGTPGTRAFEEAFRAWGE